MSGIYGLLLAAGTSSRMGQPKQLLDWYGEPLVRASARQALASSLDGLVAVVGSAAEAVRAALHPLTVGGQNEHALQIVDNAHYAAGQATSLQAGVAALPATAKAVVVLLADQPFLAPSLIDRICQTFCQSPHLAAVVPCYQGQRGTPVLLARRLFAKLPTIEGDQGARQLLHIYADDVCWLDVPDASVLRDIDTPEQYEALRHAHR